jgi:endonuclease/exonuclease/phosphatase family metal-dependent hydrolase
MKLSIVSWNVHRCIGTDGHYDPGRIAQVLNEIGADYIALQEVDSSLRAEGEIDQLSFLARETKMQAQYGATRAQDYGLFGNAVLHTAPLVVKQTLNLSYRKYEPRGALAATFELGEKKLRLVNTHLGLKYWERAFQVGTLLREFGPLAARHSTEDDQIQSHTDVICFVGDLNEWFPFSPNKYRIERPFAKTKRLPTFPSLWPRLALDRILVAGAESLSLKVYDTALARKASDHLPILAEITI